MGKRKTLPVDVKQVVLHECGYKCGNPGCRNILTLDVHHIEYVSDGGRDTADNLLPLCPYCHALHHKGEIPLASIRAWKFLLLAINEALDRRSVDILLLLGKLSQIERISGDGLPSYAGLAASGLATVVARMEAIGGIGHAHYRVDLTDKGRAFVDGWIKGDQSAALSQLPGPN